MHASRVQRAAPGLGPEAHAPPRPGWQPTPGRRAAEPRWSAVPLSLPGAQVALCEGEDWDDGLHELCKQVYGSDTQEDQVLAPPSAGLAPTVLSAAAALPATPSPKSAAPPFLALLNTPAHWNLASPLSIEYEYCFPLKVLSPAAAAAAGVEGPGVTGGVGYGAACAAGFSSASRLLT